MKIVKILSVLLMSVSLHAVGVDKKQSEFKWVGTKVTGKHLGIVKLKSGNLEMKKEKLSGGEIIIDLKTISVTDLTGKMKGRLEGHLKSDDFFNLKKYPTAMLKVKKVYMSTIVADLTIKGNTHKVEFPYKKKGNTYTGTLTFDRTKFDMRYKSGNFFKDLGDKVINDEVKLDYKIVLKS